MALRNLVFRIWRSANGTSWSQSNSAGFGDPDNAAAETLAVFGGALFAGTKNLPGGCEVWRGFSPSVFADGFESCDTTAWSVAVP